MSTNPLYKIMNSFKKDNDYTNPYDDGSVWSLSNTDSFVNPLDYGSSSNSLSDAMSSYPSIAEDPLQAPRNQIQYYTNQLGKLGVDPVEPKTNNRSTFSDTLTRLFALPSALENTVAGVANSALETVDSQVERVKQGVKAIKQGDYSKLKDLTIAQIKDTLGMGSKALVEGVKSGAYTIGSMFKPELIDKATNFGNVIDNTQDGNLKFLGDIVEAPGYLASKGIAGMLGKDITEEQASQWGNLAGDIGLSLLSGNITDIDGVGKAIKYLNKADKLDEVGKVANNLDEALELAKKSMSKSDYAKQLETTAKLSGKNIDNLNIDKLYENYLNTSAKNLMKKTDKYLGGIGDFEGVTIGHGKFQKTLLSKETLKNISEDKLKKGLVEAGLSIYSPLGAVMNGVITNKASDLIGSTETGKALKNDFENMFAFGKNNEWAKGARQAFEEGRTEDVMKNVARKGEGAIAENVRKINELWHINFTKDIKNKIDESSAKKVTTAIEGREEKYKDFVEETVVNKDYINAIKNKAKSKLDELSNSILEDLKSNKISDLGEIKNITEELGNLDSVISKTSIKYTDVLKELGAEDLEPEFFTKSLTESVESLTEELSSKGYTNANDLAKALKTATNDIIDTIEESVPTLKGRFKDVKVFDFTDELNNISKASNFEVKDVNDIKKQIKELKAKNKTYLETEGKDSEVFTNKIKKLELELEEQKAYQKLNPKVEEPKVVKPEEVEYETYMPGWSEKLDEFEPKGLKGQESTVTKEKSLLNENKNYTYEKVKVTDKLDDVKAGRISDKREMLREDLERLGIEPTSEQALDIDLLPDAKSVEEYRDVLRNKSVFKNTVNYMKDKPLTNQDGLFNYKTTDALNKWLEETGYESTGDLKMLLETLVEHRKNGEITPYLNYGKGYETQGKYKKLFGATVGTGKKTKADQKSINKIRNALMEQSGENQKMLDFMGKIEKAFDKIDKTYDMDLKQFNNMIYRAFEKEGIPLSPIQKQLVKEGDVKKLKSLISQKYKANYDNITKYMSAYEAELYSDLLNIDKLPPISEVTAKLSTDYYRTLNRAVETGEDLTESYLQKLELDKQAERDKWLVNPQEDSKYKGIYDVNESKEFNKKNGMYKKYTNEMPEDVKEILGNPYEDIEELNVVKPTVKDEVAVDSSKDTVKAKEPELTTTAQDKVSIGKVIDDEPKTPLEKLVQKQEPVVVEKQIKIEEPKTENVTKLIDKEIQKKVDGKFIGYEFEVDGSKVIIDENMSKEDIKKIFTDTMIAKNYVYTPKLEPNGRAINGETVLMNLKNTDPNLIKTIRLHEDTHIIQQVLKDPMIGGEELKKFMGTLPEAEQGKVAKLLSVLKLSGQTNTTEAHIQAKQLTGYISSLSSKKASMDTITKETDAIVGSLVLNPNTEVAELAKDIFGEDIAYRYIEARMKNFSNDISFDSDIIRTRVQDEMQGKISNLEKAYTLSNGNQEKFNAIKGILDSIDDSVDSYDNANKLLEKLEGYKNIDEEGFNEAVKGIDKHIKIYSEVERVVKIDLTKELTKEEYEVYEDVTKYFREFGLEEGIIKKGEEDLWSNYVFHSLNPKFKMDKEAQRIAREKWGSSISEVFNANQIERKFKGTIEDINSSFRNTLEKAGVDPIDLFETNITDIYLKRALGHEKVMYNKKLQDRFIEDFGMENVTRWSDKVDTVDNVINTIEKYIPSSVKEDTESYKALLQQIKDDYSKSNKTAYRFLKEDGSKYGTVGMYDYLLKDITAEEQAKKAINSRFRTTSDFDNLDYDPISYDAKSKKLVIDTEEQRNIMYQKKLESIENLKAKGMSDKSYTDHRKLAEEQGKQFVDNAMIRMEANEIVKKENVANNAILTQEERKEWLIKRRQEVREELRKKYKASKDHYYAYSDIEVNTQKAYKDMMSNMLSSGDYIEVEYVGKKNYNKYNTVGEDVDISELTPEDLSGYRVVDKSSVRTKTVVEQESNRIVFRKSDWDNYQKELQRQLKKDNNAFLKAFDKVSNTFKSMALASGRFVTNSAFGNFFESYMTSGVNLLDPTMIKNYIDYKSGKELEFNGYTTTEITNAMRLFGGAETEASNLLREDSLYKSAKGIMDKPETPLTKFFNKISPVNPLSSDFVAYRGIMKAQGEIEEMSRFINVITHLDNGEDLATAIDRTTKALFDYSDLTDFEQNVMKRVIPFYTFMRNNIPLQLENMANSPAKYQRMLDFYNSAEDLNSEREQKLKPSYLDGMLSIGNNRFLNLPNPVFELESLINPKDFAQGLNPMIKTPIELLMNKQMYSGSDISKYDKTGEKVKYAVDSVLPVFNQVSNALSDAKKGDYVKLINFLGVPVKDFDLNQAEKQTMYEYVDQLENQYYELLEKYPELKDKLENKSTSSSPLNKLLKR